MYWNNSLRAGTCLLHLYTVFVVHKGLGDEPEIILNWDRAGWLPTGLLRGRCLLICPGGTAVDR